MTNAERHEECLQTLAAVNLEAQQGKPLTPELIAHIKHVLNTCKIKKMIKDIDISIEPIFYGFFHIYGKYKGLDCNTTTSNIDCFIWLHNDSNKAKHERAYKHARKRIIQCYENYILKIKQND